MHPRSRLWRQCHNDAMRRTTWSYPSDCVNQSSPLWTADTSVFFDHVTSRHCNSCLRWYEGESCE
jgi:hypothetical protein